MKVSWLILTWNRLEKVKKSVVHNWQNAGCDIDEIIWVDNGSTDGTIEFMREVVEPDVSIIHQENQGVAKGYNRAMAVASGSHLVITGCDMLMPDGWLNTFKAYYEALPGTAVACMYSKPLIQCPERSIGPGGQFGGGFIRKETRNGLPWSHAIPLERRMFPKDFLKIAGYLREDFGLYGWEDVEWAYRAERAARLRGLVTYVIPGQAPIHLGTEGVDAFKDGGDDPVYHAFKRAEAMDPAKRELMEQCRAANWPYYNPYV